VVKNSKLTQKKEMAMFLTRLSDGSTVMRHSISKESMTRITDKRTKGNLLVASITSQFIIYLKTNSSPLTNRSKKFK